MNLKKDLLRLLTLNIFSLVIGFFNGFIIPRYLDIEQYSIYKTFGLYASYLGLFPLGFLDGMYIKYAGKNFEDINLKILRFENIFLNFLLFIETILFAIISYILKNNIMLLFSISILPYGVIGSFKMLYKSMGYFKVFSLIRYFEIIYLFLTNIILIFILKIDRGYIFSLNIVLSYYILYIFLEYKFIKQYKIKDFLIDINEIKYNFRVGFFILIGNLSILLFYSLDRWFVKFLLSVEDFAYYSFAISMMGIINNIISSIATVFYPYFAKGYSNEQIRVFKNYMIIIGSLSSFGYFVLAFIVNIFLKKYIPSLDIIAILFAGFPAIGVINTLYANLYKVNKQERKYFLTVFLMVIISFILNVIAVIINKNNQAIALATTIGFYVWFFYSSKDFKGLETNKKEILFLSLYLPLFFISTIYLKFLTGAIAFGFGVSLLILLFYKKEFLELIKKILKK